MKLAHAVIDNSIFTIDLFPSLSSQRRAVFLHHLIRQKYMERNITDRNMEDLVAAAVRWVAE